MNYNTFLAQSMLHIFEITRKKCKKTPIKQTKDEVCRVPREFLKSFITVPPAHGVARSLYRNFNFSIYNFGLFGNQEP